MLRSQFRAVVYCATICAALAGCSRETSQTVVRAKVDAEESESQLSAAEGEWRELAQLTGCTDAIKSLAFLHGGDRIVAGSFDGNLKVWEVATGRALRTIHAHPEGGFGRFAISSQRDRLATVDFNRNIKIWDTSEWECVASATGSSALYCVAFSADGKRLATSGEWKIDIWDCASCENHLCIDAGFWRITGLAFSSDGQVVYAAGFNAKEKVIPPNAGGLIRAFSVSDGQMMAECELDHPAEGFAMDPDGQSMSVSAFGVEQFRLAVNDDQVRFEGQTSFRRTQEHQGVTLGLEQFGQLSYSDDGKTLAVSASAAGPFFPKAGHLQLLNGATVEPIALLRPRRAARDTVQPGDYDFFAVAISPDGRLVAGGGAEKIVTVWEHLTMPAVAAAIEDDYDTMILPGRAETEPPLDTLGLSEAERAFEEIHRKSRREIAAIKDSIGEATDESAVILLFETLRAKHADTARQLLNFAQATSDNVVRFDALAYALWLTAGMHGDDLLAMRVRILDELRKEGMQDTEMRRVCYMLERCFDEPSERFLRSLAEESPNDEVRAHAWYSLGQLLVGKREGARHAHTLDDTTRQFFESLPREEQLALEAANVEELEAAATVAFERVIADYPDVLHRTETYSRISEVGSSGTLLLVSELARQALFNLQNLAFGQVAPDIAGEDCEGRPLRLRDSRGKVVVLCFSANWCGACVAQYPHYRALVERLKEQPLSMLHVNGDTSVESLKQSITNGTITWQCWWDGPNGNGPIARAWHVDAWPALYVLDKKGVIRHRNVYGMQLDRAVDALLAETP